MATLICFIGKIVAILLVIYALLFALYLILKSSTPAPATIDGMPALKPIPIPTKNQKTVLHKLLVFIFEVRQWEVIENWHYQFDDGKDQAELVIPKTFCFDGASIPRPFWAILSPIGLLLLPGLLHDYGYRYDQLWKVGENGKAEPFKKDAGKDYWDHVFRHVANKVNGVFLVNAFAWLAVTIGGSKSFQRHRSNHVDPEPPMLTE